MKKKVKKENKKTTKKKSNVFAIIIVVLAILVVAFNMIFRVVKTADSGFGGARCHVVIDKITHRYIGKISYSCNAVDCKPTVKFVSGKMTKKEYMELKKEIKAARAGEWHAICYSFN